MRTKTQKRWYLFLGLIEAICIVLCRKVQALRDRLDILVDTDLLKNKLCAVLLILCTLPVVFLDGDATATVFMAMFAVPMFFAKKPWIV